MEELNSTILDLEKYLNEKTCLNISNEEIKEILNNNSGRTIDVVKQLDSAVNIKLPKYLVQEVDTIQPENFIPDFPNENLTPKSAFNQIKLLPNSSQNKISSNCSTPTISNIYDDYREKRKSDLLKNIFESINNLEKTIHRFKKN